MHHEIEYTQRREDIREEYWQSYLRGARFGSGWILYSFIGVSFLRDPAGIFIVVLFLALTFFELYTKPFIRLLASLVRLRQKKISISDKGVVESTFSRFRWRTTRPQTWEQLRQRGVILERESALILSFKSAERPVLWIPKAAFIDEQHFEAVKRDLLEKLVADTTSGPELFKLTCPDTPLSSLVPDRVTSVYLVIIRGLALFYVYIAVRVMLGDFGPPIQEWQRGAAAFQVIYFVIVLLLPKSLWKKLMSFRFHEAVFSASTVTADDIRTTFIGSSPAEVLYGYEYEFNLNRFGETGALRETENHFELLYPVTKKRTPSYRLIIPKSAFASYQEADAFRALLQSKLAQQESKTLTISAAVPG